MARKPAPGARDRILHTASRLFYEQGVHEVGMQQIIDECGCGKNLLYREFASKDDLVVAYLQQKGQDRAAAVRQTIAPLAGDPAGQLVAIVRATAEAVTAPGYRGCAMLNTLAEFPAPDHPAHQLVVANYQAELDRLRDLAARAGAHDPDGLAARLKLIIDGMHANGAIAGGAAAITAAVTFAEEVVRAATRPATTSPVAQN